MMKKLNAGIFIFVITLITSAQLKAQYIIKEADAQYELFNYSKAIDLYEQAYKKKASLHAAERLAAAYSASKNYREAESWYAIAAAMPESKAENVLNYAKALQENAKYAEARLQYEKYASLNQAVTADQKQKWLLSCDSAQYWIKNPVAVNLLNEKKLNSADAEWGAVQYQNGIVFTSDRKLSDENKYTKSKPFLKFDGAKLPSSGYYGWTGNAYLNLYQTISSADSVQPFKLKRDTKYHVGAASFTADGATMYFTMTRIPDQVLKVKGEISTINIEIYSSTKDAAGNWANPKAFRYNNANKWSVGDPYIAADGKTLYFVSDMPGGKGGTDMYSSVKNDDNSWGNATNIEALNSPGNERSPFISNDGTFYFSSDGFIGMGGLDIYKASKTTSGYTVPKHLGYPLNSPQDDFFFNINSSQQGFLSSNRFGGVGSDDIYSFIKQEPLLFKLEGIVYDKNSNARLSNAVVTLSKEGAAPLVALTDANGMFKFSIDKGFNYSLKGEKTNYRKDTASVNTFNLSAAETLHKDLFLVAITIDKPIRIDNIYYDFDKWNIRPEAALELDKLVAIMKANETIWIELGSHTDSRGSDAYNLWLSQKRADAAVDYILSRGIQRNRITAKGYGETQLVNKCANGVKCTEAEHQLNRRTEFKIVKQ
ncbi:OmpA family protein [Pedobacter nototheniae]|uniref:OmpA family protein n=1 Tax=Pedobacter nototheniae TaxID=2488994 RepID=UPI00292F52FB|nr:OmpA family protein [Pedobacter nototheniae]